MPESNSADNTQLIGIFGGTFDPLHVGHLNAVQLLDRAIHFDVLHWVLSARPPHKEDVSAPIEHRFAMLQLALQSEPRFIADDREIARHTPSYTVDTVDSFREQYPQANLMVIIGADSLLNLPRWHRYDELVEKVNWVVIRRPGYPLTIPDSLQSRFVAQANELSSCDGGKMWLFDTPDFDVSSSQIRDLLRQPSWLDAPSLKQLLVSDIIGYIRAHQLYKIKIMNSEQIKQQVVEAIDDLKGQDIKVIDIADISDFADYMIVVSGTSDTHVKALARNASDTLRKQDVNPLNEDGADVGEWVLVDFGDVVLHVMRPEVREYYDLEKLWDEDVRNLVKQHREKDEA